jgi:hypothetical protein
MSLHMAVVAVFFAQTADDRVWESIVWLGLVRRGEGWHVYFIWIESPARIILLCYFTNGV